VTGCHHGKGICLHMVRNCPCNFHSKLASVSTFTGWNLPSGRWCDGGHKSEDQEAILSVTYGVPS